MKKLSRVSAALLAAVLLAGCGSIGSKNGDGGYYSVNEAASADAAYDSAAGAANSSIVPEELPDSTDETAQKIIYNADINMESTDFDAARDSGASPSFRCPPPCWRRWTIAARGWNTPA